MLISLTLFCAVFTAPAFASFSSIKQIFDTSSFENVPEKAEIEAAIKEKNPLGFMIRNKDALNRAELAEVNDATDLTIGWPVKVFIPDESVIQALMKNDPLAKLLKQSPYSWEFPVINKKSGECVGSFRVEKIQGKWEFSEVGGYLSSQTLFLISDSSRLADFMGKAGVNAIEDYVFFTVMPLHTTFLLVVKNGEEYLVPFIHGGWKEAYGLRSGEIYSRDKVVSAVGPVLQQFRDNPSSLAGYPNKTGSKNMFKLPLIILLIIIFGAVAGFYVFRRRMGQVS